MNMKMAGNNLFRQQLKKHLEGGEAFVPLDKMLKEIKFDKLGERPDDLPYSFYELFHHIWFTQNDILKYCTKGDYTAPIWPKDYWPEQRAPQNIEDWEKLKEQYKEDRQKLSNLIVNSEKDISKPVPSNSKHSLFREILLVIEHTAYHSGQLLILLRHLGLHSS